jgi:tRNA U34 5-methylaminomethyl-2-thiouridine-forming methyltransferase MnmC
VLRVQRTIYRVKDKGHKLNKIITTADGSHTIYVPEMDEHYHSVHGAIQESEYIFIKNGYDVCNTDPLYIFEAGFGTGLNTLLTAIRNLNGNRKVFYTAFEKYPVNKTTINSLNYPGFFGSEGKEIFNLIHSCRWGQMNRINRNFSLKKVKGDLVTDVIVDRYGLVYFDAFGPDKQPEMWTVDIFKKIGEATEKNGVFITYSSKGEVKRNLRTCGFRVILLSGPRGKRHIIRAVKT